MREHGLAVGPRRRPTCRAGGGRRPSARRSCRSSRAGTRSRRGGSRRSRRSSASREAPRRPRRRPGRATVGRGDRRAVDEPGSKTRRRGSQSARIARSSRAEHGVERHGDGARRDRAPERGCEERSVGEDQRDAVAAVNAGVPERPGEAPELAGRAPHRRPAPVRRRWRVPAAPLRHMPPDEPSRRH